MVVVFLLLLVVGFMRCILCDFIFRYVGVQHFQINYCHCHVSQSVSVTVLFAFAFRLIMLPRTYYSADPPFLSLALSRFAILYQPRHSFSISAEYIHFRPFLEGMLEMVPYGNHIVTRNIIPISALHPLCPRKQLSSEFKVHPLKTNGDLIFMTI